MFSGLGSVSADCGVVVSDGAMLSSVSVVGTYSEPGSVVIAVSVYSEGDSGFCIVAVACDSVVIASMG